MKKIFLFLMLTACSFKPIFSGSNTDIYVAPISGINGIELRNSLNSQFGGMHDQTAMYSLTVNLQEPVTRYKALERAGDVTQVVNRGVFDGQAAAEHGRHAYETAHFNHVGQHPVFRSVQGIDAGNGEQIACHAFYLRSHAIEHPAELLHVRLTGCIVNGSDALGQDGSHHDVGRSRHRSLV